MRATPAMTFDEWCAELRAEAAKDGTYKAYGDDPIKACGADAWRESFNDGRTPREALDDDYSYWEE